MKKNKLMKIQLKMYNNARKTEPGSDWPRPLVRNHGRGH